MPTLSQPRGAPLGLHVWVPGKVLGVRWIHLCAPVLLLPWFIPTSLRWRGLPGGDALVVPGLGQILTAPNTSGCTAWDCFLLSKCCGELFIGLT